jgi:hypothetical protein
VGHAPEVYALWSAGLLVLAFTLVQAVRAGSGLSFGFPRLSGRQLSSLVGWLLIAASALIVVARQR